MQMLNLGCGDSYWSGWVNADLYAKKVDKRFDFNEFPYPFKDNFFDHVYSSHTLEHLEEPVKVMEELWRISKPNSRVKIIVPHYSGAGAHTPLHKTFWGTNAIAFVQNSTGRYGKHDFKIVSSRINWTSKNQRTAFLNKLMNPLINASIPLYERFWCYWFGGAHEIEWILKVKKNQNNQ